MSTFLSIRNYVYFRHLFDAVHPFFWPVLYWQLKAAWISLQREKLTSVLLAVTWWGGVRIVYRGDKIETPSHTPLEPLKPRWDDPVWSMDVPAEFLEATHTLILPCEAGACRDQRSHCDRPGKESGTLLTPNTS
jgi:hypothetical protein